MAFSTFRICCSFETNTSPRAGRIRRTFPSTDRSTMFAAALLIFLATNSNENLSVWAWPAADISSSHSHSPTRIHSCFQPSPIVNRRHKDTVEHSIECAHRRPEKLGQRYLTAMGNSAINGEHAAPASSIPVAEVDVRHGIRTSLIYDDSVGRYVSTPINGLSEGGNGIRKSVSTNAYDSVLRMLSSNFLPEGVTPSYYRFMRWRIVQRFINANVHVFGTQSLLLGLGIKSRNALGLGAALNWVLKDALGKIVRMLWASRMGRKFDPDAKRWRFRSAFVFAAGNGLEVATYVFPQLFLIFATVANCCKQVSMLTSSATRNALYNSFRDGKRENIGDITAKGEAQIAVVDLLGIGSGVLLSRAVGVSVKSVLTIWVLLQAVEIFCMYHEIRSVVFRMLNFERLYHVIGKFVSSAADYGLERVVIPTPDEMGHTEKIFLPPSHLARRGIAFGSLGRAQLSPDELSELMNIFQKDKFLLVVGENKKSGRKLPQLLHRDNKKNLKKAKLDAQANCHIVLHADANNVDIVKSTLALAFLRKKLADSVLISESGDAVLSPARSSDCFDMIRLARDQADYAFPTFLKTLSSAGWAPPARYMFGRVTMRAEWPIQGRAELKETTASGTPQASFPPT